MDHNEAQIKVLTELEEIVSLLTGPMLVLQKIGVFVGRVRIHIGRRVECGKAVFGYSKKAVGLSL